MYKETRVFKMKNNIILHNENQARQVTKWLPCDAAQDLTRGKSSSKKLSKKLLALQQSRGVKTKTSKPKVKPAAASNN